MEERRGEFAGKTVVTFCTGGIRCEKAAIHMQTAGFDSVYQLDGGILKYFDETSGAHYHGDCFVFDERRTVDVALSPASSLKDGAAPENPVSCAALAVNGL